MKHSFNLSLMLGLLMVITCMTAAVGQDIPTASPPAEETAQAEPKLISIAFKDMSVEQIGKFLSDHRGKPVIVHQSVKDRKITIVATDKMPTEEAIFILHEALRQHGVFVEEQQRLMTIRPLTDAKQSLIRVIGEDEDLNDLPNKAEVVNKVFTARHYDVVKLKDAILPMLPEFGHVTADPNARKLVVTDSIANLERIAQVIAMLDTPLADQTMPRVIELEHADAAWMVSMLNTLLGGGPSARSGNVTNTSGTATQAGAAPPGQPGRPMPPGASPSPTPGGPAPSATIARASGAAMMLTAEVSRNWIIAVAPAETMQQIEAWVKELDRPDNDQTQFSIFTIQYADPEDVVQYLRQALEALPGRNEGARLVPFSQQRRVLAFGSERTRELIEDLLTRIDVEGTGDHVMKVIELRHADAEQVAKNITALFGQQSTTRSPFYYGYRPPTPPSRDVELKVADDTRRNSITVVADAATMAEIEKIIREEWDKPLATDDVQPRVYQLQYADPVQLKDLLESMFSRRLEAGSHYRPWWDDSPVESVTAVGRLFGQFSFQTLPDSNRLVVTTKNAENYTVIDELIAELDQPQEAGLPYMVELKHAHAEDLAEQLNAMLAESGTLAEITRSIRDLSVGRSISVSDATNEPRGGAGPQQPRGQQPDSQRDPNMIRFWWQSSRDRGEERQQASNLIGRIRVVPVNRRNALLIMAPKGYLEPIRELIQDLDRPGMQVVIHAIIAEIQHDNATTLGVRLASDPAAFADSRLVDQSIRGGANMEFTDIFGGSFATGDGPFSRGILRADVNLNFLIQLLIRRFELRILFEPKIYTADNQEAEFFDGQDVSIQTGAQVTPEGTINREFRYVAIGTRLRVRPHITHDGDVALTINLEVSRIVPGESTFGNPVFDRRETTTRVIVHNNQTVMLSGIIRQEDFSDIRKLPVLGDLPLLGGLFRSTEKAQANRELIAFITPQVIINSSEDAKAELEHYRRSLERFREGMTLPWRIETHDEVENETETQP